MCQIVIETISKDKLIPCFRLKHGEIQSNQRDRAFNDKKREHISKTVKA